MCYNAPMIAMQVRMEIMTQRKAGAKGVWALRKGVWALRMTLGAIIIFGWVAVTSGSAQAQKPADAQGLVYAQKPADAQGPVYVQDSAHDPAAPIILVDYGDFPEGWKVRGKRERVPQIYQIRTKGGRGILSAKVEGKPIRIFKKVSWNPFTHPILTWKWRVLSWPDDPEASVDFYVSLGRDTLGIPIIIKYVWSRSLPVGQQHGGGFFRAHEVVVRSGPAEPEKWIISRLNVLESFRYIHGRDPSHEAVGVGLLVSTGVEMEISGISALPEE